MLWWRSVAIATTPGTRGSDVTTRFKVPSAAALGSVVIVYPPSRERLSTWRLLQGVALVAARGDLVAPLAVGAHAARVGEDPARLALDVRAQVPGVGPGDQGRVGELVVVRDPAVLRLPGGLDHRPAGLPHVPDAVADPLHLLLQAGRHVAQRRRGRERHRGREQVRVAVHLEAHGGADVPAPVLLERPAAPAADVDAGQGPRPGVEAGRQDDDVELVDRAVRGPDALRDHALDRVVLDADDLDVGAAVDLEVADLERDAVRAEAVVGRDQQLAEPRILQPRAHLLAHELGDLPAHPLVEEHLGERGEPQLQRAVVPDLLQHLAAPLRRQVGPAVPEVVLEAGEGVGQRAPQLVEPRLVGRRVPRAVLRVLHRQDVLRRADEHLQVSDLGRDGLDDLDAGGADADDADALAGEPGRLLRPPPRVDDRSLERVLPREDVGQGCGEHAAAGDQEPGVDRLAGVGLDGPAPGRLVVARAGDRGVEPDVLPEVETVGDVVQPALDLRLAGELLAPAPALVELFREEVLVDVALGVEAGTRVTVPVPGATDIRRRIVCPYIQSLVLEQVQLVEARHASADDQCVQFCPGSRFGFSFIGTFFGHDPPPGRLTRRA